MKSITFDTDGDKDLEGLSDGDEVCVKVRGTVSGAGSGKFSIDDPTVELSHEDYDEPEEEEEEDEEKESKSKSYPADKKAVIMIMKR